MTIPELLSLSTTELESMSDIDFRAYLAPHLAYSRPTHKTFTTKEPKAYVPRKVEPSPEATARRILEQLGVKEIPQF
jgi:hypothetical protein